jgi:hypothetical protein
VRRAELLTDISDRLDGAQLVWFGTRGDDIEAVADIPELTAAFSLISAYDRRTTIDGVSLESLSGRRVDLDAYDVDDHLHEEATVAFRRMLLRVLSRPSALFTYRPSTFVSAISFARRDRCRYLGLFKDHQSAFEHKPWVETAVAELDIPHVPWVYVADEEQLDTLRYLEEGPVMLRRSRTNGGVGLAKVDDSAQLAELWPEQEEAYVSVAPYIERTLPVNVSAVVWHDGVTLHPASVQLIGVPRLTTRQFGYCGNDFGACRSLQASQLDAMGDATVAVGNWLRAHGYLGAFGVDFLVDESGVPLFTEVNPRFQGSTHASCRISVEQGESCLMLEHIAALLRLDAPPCRKLSEWAADMPPFAHFVVHSTLPEAAQVDATGLVDAVLAEPQTARADVVVSPALTTERGATVARVSVRDRLTTTGYELHDPWRRIVSDWAVGAAS